MTKQRLDKNYYSGLMSRGYVVRYISPTTIRSQWIAHTLNEQRTNNKYII